MVQSIAASSFKNSLFLSPLFSLTFAALFFHSSAVQIFHTTHIPLLAEKSSSKKKEEEEETEEEVKEEEETEEK